MQCFHQTTTTLLVKQIKITLIPMPNIVNTAEKAKRINVVDRLITKTLSTERFTKWNGV